MSTLVELLGFGCFVAASFIWQAVPLEVITGLVALGGVLLVVGYAVDDQMFSVSLTRASAPVRARLAARKAVKATQ